VVGVAIHLVAGLSPGIFQSSTGLAEKTKGEGNIRRLFQ